MDVTDVGPFTRVQCPECSEEVRVKTEMGPYVLRRRLAIGGMSVLFVAYDKMLGREVAVKVLNEDYSGDESRVAQFEQEAKLTAAVSHPNVVRVYTVGRAFGRYFIAMELVSGRSLEIIMDERGALPETEIMPIALQVVDGLRAAHSAGLIHRDIKPGNILIDDKGTAKIVDFGLSLLTEGGAVQAEEVWATPYYVPPEALMNLEEDFRSDIYALGASLYHALSGHPPVQSREMSTRVLQEEKKSVKPIGKLASWLHPESMAVIDRAMQHSANRRFGSYEQFRAQLKSACDVVAGDPETLPIHGTARAERRRCSGVRLKNFLIAVLVVAALVGAVLFVLKRVGERLEEPGTGGESGLSDAPFVAGSSDLAAVDQRRIGEAYRQAREALARHDYVAAGRWFEEVALDPSAPASTAGWARFEAVVAAYLNGRPGDARKHIATLKKEIKERGMSEAALGRRLRAACQILDSLEFVSDEKIPVELAEPVRATAYFAMALKMWEQGQLDRSRDHLTKLVEAGPWEDADWMVIYQSLAQHYLEEHARLAEVDRRVDSNDRAALEAKHDELAELYVLLETRGRARFNVRAWQADLKRTVRALEDASKIPDWSVVRADIVTRWRAGDFAGAGRVLGSYTPASDEAVLKKSAMVAAIASANEVWSQLRKIREPIELGEKMRDRSGRQFGQVLSASKDGISFGVEREKVHRSWHELKLESVLSLYMQVVRNQGDRGNRALQLGPATAFALLGGLSAQEELLFARVKGEPAPGGFGTWEDLMSLLQGE